MPRNRFELLLRFWHFATNEEAQYENRLRKKDEILQKFIANFQSSYSPTQKICIDETMVPWRSRLFFRQYIPSKRHRYGIKLYKLYTGKGFTWNLSVYIGKDKSNDSNLSASESVVIKLVKDLLDEGRTLYTDNFYTSVPLARTLLSRNTHVVSTIRKNRKYIPDEVKFTRLQRGEIIGRRNHHSKMEKYQRCDDAYY